MTLNKMTKTELLSLKDEIEVLLNQPKDDFWDDVKVLDCFQNEALKIEQKRVAFSQNSLFLKALNLIGFDVISECAENDDTCECGCSIYNLSKTTHAMLEEGIQYGCQAYSDGTFSYTGFEQPTDEEKKMIRFIIASKSTKELQAFIESQDRNALVDFLDKNRTI